MASVFQPPLPPRRSLRCTNNHGRACYSPFGSRSASPRFCLASGTAAGLLAGVFDTGAANFSLEVGGRAALGLPPTVLGFYMLVAMGPRGPLGKIVANVVRTRTRFHFHGLVLASVLYSLPFAVQPLIASFEAVDRKLLDASAVLGAAACRTFWRVILPLSIPGVVDRAGAQLCAHHRRIRRGAYGRRQSRRASRAPSPSISTITCNRSNTPKQTAWHLILLAIFVRGALRRIWRQRRRIGRRVWSPWPAK